MTTLDERLLDVIEHDVVPLTRAGVALGNKLFGAAILLREDLSVVVAATNNEVENPLWHGEIHAIKLFHERKETPDPAGCVFLATHEPCSLCLSGIAWGGFPEVHYLFSHQDSADSFAIPHDLRILRAVYAVPDPDRSAAGDVRRAVGDLPGEQGRCRHPARVRDAGFPVSGSRPAPVPQ